VNPFRKGCFIWLALVGLVACCSAANAQSQSKAKAKPKDDPKQQYAQGNKLVKLADNLSLSAVVGKSPWLIMAAGGAWSYYQATAEQRSELGFFASPIFFLPTGLLVLLVGFKDTLLSWAAWLKVPLNALGELFHMSGGLFAYLYLGSVALDGTMPDTATASLAWANTPTQEMPANDMTFSALSYLLMCVVHTAVWIVFNGVEVAILSPFPFVDAILKTGRTALIGVITGLAAIHPVLGFLISAPIILVCLFCIPVALRVTLVGWVYTWDILGRMIGKHRVVTLASVSAFASWSLGAPLLAYGTLLRTPEGKLVFSYRRLVVLWKRQIELPEQAVLGLGTINPYLFSPGTEQSGEKLLLRLPPGYASKESEIAQQLGLAPPVDISTLTTLRQGWQRFWNWLRGR
jgi:hypothetical protein